MIKKSDIQSLIVTQDREFKQRGVNFFNNIAFNAEKITVSTIEEAQASLLSNAKILNVLIDGAIFKDKLNEDFVHVEALFDKPDLYGILYLPEKMPAPFAHQEHKIKNLSVFSLPFSKNHFNEIFHRKRHPGETPEHPAQAEGNAPKKTVSVTAFEASNHVRDTIAMIQALEKNKESLLELQQIGQRFNGIVGTFAFFTKMPGYKELRRLAIIIDRIGKHYSDHTEMQKITDEHFQLLLSSAKTSFILLQALREQKPIPNEFNEALAKIEGVFKDSGIKDIENVSQNEVDQLIEQMK